MALTKEEVVKMLDERMIGVKIVLDEREASIGTLMAGASAKLIEIEQLQARTVITVEEHEQRISKMLAGCNEEFAVVRSKYEVMKTETDLLLGELRKAKEGQDVVEGTLSRAAAKFQELEEK